MKRRTKNGHILKVQILLFLDQIFFILDQTLPILKKDRKIYLKSDSTFLDQILLT